MSRSSPESGGLGLIIVKRMLQLHGSDIQLGAGTPSGTVMSFQLSTAQ